MSRSYKLLISLKIDPPRKYKELLSKFETATGFPTRFQTLIKNIGQNSFPGGVITDNTILFQTSFGQVNYSHSLQTSTGEIGSIKPKKTIAIEFKGDVMIPFPGPWRMIMGIETKDKAKIDFFQYPEGSPIEKWYAPFYAIGHHQLDLIVLLKALLKKR